MENSPGGISHEAALPLDAERLIKEFVGHWGLMARAWGINSTMGELFALLYITGTEWTADDLRNWLGVSRGNVSMNLRELLVVGSCSQGTSRRRASRVVPSGDRRLDPVSQDPERTETPGARSQPQRSRSCISGWPRMTRLAGAEGPDRAAAPFFRLIDSLAVQLLSLPSGDLAEFSRIARDDKPKP